MTMIRMMIYLILLAIALLAVMRMPYRPDDYESGAPVVSNACCMGIVPPLNEFAHPILTAADVKIIHLLTRLEGNPFQSKTWDKRAILIGTPAQWLDAFYAVGFESWRLTHTSLHRFDVISNVIEMPIRKQSVHVVVFGGHSGYSAWGAMRMLSESIYSVIPYGYFIFDAKRCQRFPSMLQRFGWERLPFQWMGMSIWQKPQGGHHGGIIRIREDDEGDANRAFAGLFGGAA